MLRLLLIPCSFLFLSSSLIAQDNIDYKQIANDVISKKKESKEYIFHQCKHLKGETLRRVIENFLTPSGTVASNRENDTVVISDKKENIPSLKAIIAKLDQEIPQVMIEARVVEFTVDSDFEKEVNVAFNRLPAGSNGFIQEISSILNTPGANPSTGQGNAINATPFQRTRGLKTDQLTVFLRYLQTAGKAEILSAPSLALMRGEEGSIITGEEVPILTQTVVSGSVSTSTEFKSVGIKLRVKPLSIANDKIRLEINPEVSTVTGFSNSNPIIAVRNARTVLKVANNQMVAIGGLMRSEKREVTRRVPVLGSIPLLGWFFRSKRIEEVKTQLVIFTRLRILSDDIMKTLIPGQESDLDMDQRLEEIKKKTFFEKPTLKTDKKLLLEQEGNK